ncbi:MAG: hypothetical protein ABI647_11180 [Gemmatimonadota bacterium]
MTLGFRVKSGWAAVVLLRGPASSPTVLDARRIDLADPKELASVQPYHEGFGKAQPDQRIVTRLVRLVERCAERNIAELIAGYRKSGHTPRRAAVVGASATDPATISNPHIRIHALEGQLFRRVVGDALTASGIPWDAVLEQELEAEAPPLLGQPWASLRRRVTELGSPNGGPWRAEQKSAGLAAWLQLPSR